MTVGARTSPSSTWSCGGSPRTHGSPRCLPWSTPGWLPVSCRRLSATCWGRRRETGCARRWSATSPRRAPRCASRSRSRETAHRPSSPSTSQTARPPTSGPATRHCGPRRSRHTGSGSPSRWQRTRSEECCGPARSPGTPLADAVEPDQLPEATASLGALLAAVHASSVPLTRDVVVDDLLVETHKKAAKLVRAHPPITSVVADVVTATTRRRGEARHERVRTLHGDFHLAQLVSSPRGPVLVDLDSMVHGPPEVDLAEFLVELALRELPARVKQAVAHGLLASYSRASGTEIDAALLETCAGVEFLHRCYRHLHRHSPGWQSALETDLGRHAEMTSLLRA
ncbi:phosphotransferase [Nocardioides panacis]|uniref:Phosphotransferase n=1 Tax=Nocardioides panacis TaxID=2849501 RepID=A0A975Y1M5_9ACTN|nr:phosphotransferase [Nocardioides panacis]QWZ09666.1 phosphotransferase [Nocardioides panacis]